MPTYYVLNYIRLFNIQLTQQLHNNWVLIFNFKFLLVSQPKLVCINLKINYEKFWVNRIRLTTVNLHLKIERITFFDIYEFTDALGWDEMIWNGMGWDRTVRDRLRLG